MVLFMHPGFPVEDVANQETYHETRCKSCKDLDIRSYHKMRMETKRPRCSLLPTVAQGMEGRRDQWTLNIIIFIGGIADWQAIINGS